MDHTIMLTHVLKLHFGWHLARIKCLSCLIIALFKVKNREFCRVSHRFFGFSQSRLALSTHPAILQGSQEPTRHGLPLGRLLVAV